MTLLAYSSELKSLRDTAELCYVVDERDVVRLYSAGLTQSEVGERVGLGQSRISQILSKHNVDTGFNGWWTAEETAFLEKHYPPESVAEKEVLLKQLCGGKRSWNAVRGKAAALDLTRPEEEYRGSADNRRILARATKRIEIDLSDSDVGYLVGVLDSDGYTNNRSMVGLEVADQPFLEKVEEKLDGLGFNPTKTVSHHSETKSILYASSKQFVEWYEADPDRFSFSQEQKRLYIEAMFEGDGTIHKMGYIMICSTNGRFKEFLAEFLQKEFDFSTSIWQDGIALVPKGQRDQFLELIDPVVKGPDYYADDRGTR